MRRIDKGAPPPSLVAYAKQQNPPPSFDDCPKTELRACLVRDQGGLCCYCMRRIDTDPLRTKIEHLRSQARDPRLQLEWKNLFAACPGGQGSPLPLQTCDTRKGDNELLVDPVTIREDEFKYTETGRIETRDTEKQRDLDETLNLNAVTLTRARIAVLEELRRRLGQKLGASKTWTAAALARERGALGNRRPLPELLGLLEYWILRHERRR